MNGEITPKPTVQKLGTLLNAGVHAVKFQYRNLNKAGTVVGDTSYGYNDGFIAT